MARKKESIKYSFDELQAIQSFVQRFLDAAIQGVADAREAVGIADVQMLRGQLHYWESCVKCLNWQLSSVNQRIERILKNG